MKREHAEWQTGRHQQLNLRRAAEHVGAETETDRGHGGGAAIADEIADQIVRACDAQSQRQQKDKIDGENRIAGRPVGRNGQQAGAQIRLRIQERSEVRIENIGIEHVTGIHHQRPGHPGDVPDRELAISGIDPPNVAHLKGKRIGETDRQCRADCQDDERFTPASCERLAGHAISLGHLEARGRTAVTAENRSCAPSVR